MLASPAARACTATRSPLGRDKSPGPPAPCLLPQRATRPAVSLCPTGGSDRDERRLSCPRRPRMSRISRAAAAPVAPQAVGPRAICGRGHAPAARPRCNRGTGGAARSLRQLPSEVSCIARAPSVALGMDQSVPSSLCATPWRPSAQARGGRGRGLPTHPPPRRNHSEAVFSMLVAPETVPAQRKVSSCVARSPQEGCRARRRVAAPLAPLRECQRIALIRAGTPAHRPVLRKGRLITARSPAMRGAGAGPRGGRPYTHRAARAGSGRCHAAQGRAPMRSPGLPNGPFCTPTAGTAGIHREAAHAGCRCPTPPQPMPSRFVHHKPRPRT
eukprot:gene641-biopygen13698